MKSTAFAASVTVLLSIGCLAERSTNTAVEGKAKSTSLPIASPWEPTTCKLLDIDSKSIVEIEGREVVYDADPNGPSEFKAPTRVSAFVSPVSAWIGPECDFYLQSQKKIVGLKCGFSGITWFTGFAEVGDRRSLDDVISSFESSVSHADLETQVRKAFGNLDAPDEPIDGLTPWTPALPELARIQLIANSPTGSTWGQVKFLNAEMDGSLIKAKISNITGQLTPTIWIDPKSKQIIKAEDYTLANPYE